MLRLLCSRHSYRIVRMYWQTLIKLPQSSKGRVGRSSSSMDHIQHLMTLDIEQHIPLGNLQLKLLNARLMLCRAEIRSCSPGRLLLLCVKKHELSGSSGAWIGEDVSHGVRRGHEGLMIYIECGCCFCRAHNVAEVGSLVGCSCIRSRSRSEAWRDTTCNIGHLGGGEGWHGVKVGWFVAIIRALLAFAAGSLNLLSTHLLTQFHIATDEVRVFVASTVLAVGDALESV
mmetsp:Transcript_15573/g.24210  ORF Transcript_15573/g.24210 Transcript_15573/m.24210 type:complete len:229 (-) Transcript_15573:475-1161(-)